MKINFKKKNEILLIGIFLSLLIWFMNFPQYRFGFASILIFILMLINFVIGESAYYNKKANYNVIYFYYLFNASNIIRIHKEFNRSDIYKFENFPWYAKPKLKYITESSNNILFERSFKMKTFGEVALMQI